MKYFLRFVIVLGFVVMLGAAGGADAQNFGFFKLVLLEMLGMLLVVFGCSALCHYKRYLHKCMINALKTNSKNRKRELC